MATWEEWGELMGNAEINWDQGNIELSQALHSAANDMYDEIKAKEKVTKPTFEETGGKIGRLVNEKNKSYGNSFGKSGDVLKILYPDGIKPDQYSGILTLIRIIDKLFRIATDKDAFKEEPWNDIAGYAILKANEAENKNP